MHPILAEIIGWEFLLILLLIALVFGSSQLPKLARSLGQASRELRRGQEEGYQDAAVEKGPEQDTTSEKE